MRLVGETIRSELKGWQVGYNGFCPQSGYVCVCVCVCVRARVRVGFPSIPPDFFSELNEAE